MAIKDISLVIEPSKRVYDKQTSEAITLHYTTRLTKTINLVVPDPTKQRNRKRQEIPYEKLIIIAELLK